MYNEQDRIEPTLRDVVTTLRNWSRGGPRESFRPWMFHPPHSDESAAPPLLAEILLVNDGSHDATQGVAETLLRQLLSPTTIQGKVLRHTTNSGKGAAVQTGLTQARGAWILVMDADNATRLDQLERFERALGGLLIDKVPGVPSAIAMIAGSRNSADAEIEAKFTRRLAGNVFKSALWLLGLRLAKDTQCGFKLYRRDLARYLTQYSQEPGFAFDIEHFLLCMHGGWKFREVGVHWEHKAGGKINVVKDGLRMVVQAKAIRDRLRRHPPLPSRSPAPAQPTPTQISNQVAYSASVGLPVSEVETKPAAIGTETGSKASLH